ncbi:DUF4055 domain-containing protein [Klebsiella pneumoniae subsp. pneumoniae]|nr:DUF4055 domain-containing protein [Klebsiella pneumoniae subsp. pneumoniae]
MAKEAMDSKRDYSVQLGARLIEQNGAVKTATQSSGEQTASTSVLGICVSNVSGGLYAGARSGAPDISA